MFKFLSNNYSQPLALTVFLGLFTCLAIAVPASAQGQNSFENYRQQCLRRVEQVGVKGAAAQEVCNCTINKFKQKYSLAEFSKLVQQSETNQAIARQLAEVGEDCLYE
jgi:hypothetical protein